MPAALIPPARRSGVVWVCAATATGFVVLALLLEHRSATAFDSWMFGKLYAWIPDGAAPGLLGLSAPAISISLCVAVAIIAAIARRWNVVSLAVVAPALTVGLTKWVFKPLVGRSYGTDQVEPVFGTFSFAKPFTVSGVFPSGHESAVASTACLLVIAGLQLPLSRRVRTIAFASIALWTLAAAVGLVRNFWHYATDTIGAMLLATVVVFGLALLIDSYGARIALRVRARRRAAAQRG